MAIGPHAESEAHVLDKHDLSAPSSSQLSVALVTPRGSLASRGVDEIVAPGVQGEFGVLPGHVAFISALKPGVLVLRNGSKRDLFAVGPGYLQVSASGQTRILVQDAAAGPEVDTEEARSDRAAAEEQLKQLATTDAQPGDLTSAQNRLAWGQARLDAAAASSRGTGG